MEKNQYDICLKVLRRMEKQGILKDILLIGSWCVYFYDDYFTGLNYTPSIRTRDVDFLVPLPLKIKRKVDIPDLLKDLGFVIDFLGTKGYIRLQHPELIVEFLVPERGKGSDKPYPLPDLGINAQPLRFLDFLIQNIIEVKFKGITIKLPHPAAFALQKLMVFQRRTKNEKAERERNQAFMILDFILKKRADNDLKRIFNSMHKKWQDKILKVLSSFKQDQVIEILRGMV